MNTRILLILFLGVIILAGCNINKDIMFRTPIDYTFDEFPSEDSLEYRISVNDRVRFSLFSNSGYKLIDLVGQGQAGNGTNSAQVVRQFGLNYLIESDGKAKLPTLGRTELVGLTIIEAENMLEERYSEFYKDPFVQLSVVNNRVIVSTGAGGTAHIVVINDNMTVIEVLARAGGIASRGNSSKIKVIRNIGESKEVYELDLSKIDGMYEGDLIVQANDIIYVEPRPELARELLQDVAPILTLITSTIALVTILTR